MPCSGYSQELVFIAAAPRAVQSKPKANMKSRITRVDEENALTTYTKKNSQLGTWSQPRISIRTISLPGAGRLELKQDIDFIIQHFAASSSEAPAEFNVYHNQICGGWVEVLPLVTETAKEKPFLASAIKTMSTALQIIGQTPDESKTPMLAMYGASLRQMSKALQEAHGVFRYEHCIAIMCLSATNVSVRDMLFGVVPDSEII